MNIQHPAITAAEIWGYSRRPKEPRECPFCGSQTFREIYIRETDNTVIGCDRCTRTIDSAEYEEMEE